MKTRIILAIASLTMTGIATAQPLHPGRCPLPDQIRAAGLEQNVVEQDSKGQWAVGRMKANYNTKADWTFVVGQIAANGPDDAYNKATASLASLAYLSGPQYMQQIGRWVCRYSTSTGYPAVAVTPILQGATAALQSIK